MHNPVVKRTAVRRAATQLKRQYPIKKWKSICGSDIYLFVNLYIYTYPSTYLSTGSGIRLFADHFIRVLIYLFVFCLSVYLPSN